MCSKTVMSVVTNQPERTNTSIFARALVATDLHGGALSTSNSQATIFAPSDAAFRALAAEMGVSVEALLNDTATLTGVLLYHVVPGQRLLASSLRINASLTTADSGLNLTVGAPLTNASLVSLRAVGSAASLTSPDLDACSSIVHVIDTVLLPFHLPPLPHPFDLKAAALIAAALSATAFTATTLSTIAAVEIYKALAAAGLVPALGAGAGGALGRNATSPPPPPACSTVAALVAATPSLSTLLAAVQAANLTAALSSRSTPMTVFAPTNAAFASLLASLNVSAASLLSNQALLTKVLTLHVVPGVAAFAANLSNSQTLPTVAGERLTVLLGNGTVTIRAPSSSALVTTPNLSACAAVVHIIDHVLLPAVPSPPSVPSRAASPPPAVNAQSGPSDASPPPAGLSPPPLNPAAPPPQQSSAAAALSLAATLVAAAAALAL